MNISYHKNLIGVVNDDRYGRGVWNKQGTEGEGPAKEDLAATDTSAVTNLSHCR
jgi:hypothetical protein